MGVHFFKTTNLLFICRRDPIVLSVEEVIQEEQEGCIRMSKRMKEFCYKELRGEIPGLKGDLHFGATVTEDLNSSAIVERIAQDQHCKSCKPCSPANAIKLHGSAAEGGDSWWLRRSLEAQEQEEAKVKEQEAQEQEAQEQEAQEQEAQEQEAQEPEEVNGEEQDSWWQRMSSNTQAWGEAWWRSKDAHRVKRIQKEQEEQERLEHNENQENEEEQEQMDF